MNDSFKLKQKQKEEIRRLKRICFPPKDKEASPSGAQYPSTSVTRTHAALQMRQECDRILQNLPTQSRNGFERFKSALRKASVQENMRNEKKFKSLERNFQRFTERYSSRSFRQLSGVPFNRSTDAFADNKENMFTSNLDISPIRHNTSAAQNYLSLNHSMMEGGVHDAGHFPAHYEESRAVINRVCDEMGVFFHRVLHGMIQMSVTNSQEIELRKRLAEHLGSIQRFRLTINNAFEGDQRQFISQHSSQRSAALAFEELLQAFNVSIAELSTRFEGLVSKIQAVSSHSFQKYKMKDICALFDTLCEEFHRMHVLDFVPLLSQKYTDLRVANGLTQFSKFMAIRNIKLRRQVLRLLEHDTELKDERIKDMKKKSGARILTNIGTRRVQRVMSSALVRWTRTAVSGRVYKEEGVHEATTQLFESLIQRSPQSSTLFREAGAVLSKLVFGNAAHDSSTVDFIAYDQAKRTAYTYGEKGEELIYEGNDLQHSILGKVIQFHEIYNSGQASQDASFNPLVDSGTKQRMTLMTRMSSKNNKTHSRSSSYKNENHALMYFPVFNKHKEFTGVLRLTQSAKNSRFASQVVESVSRFAQALGSIVQDYLHSNKQFTHLQSELISISSRNSVHEIQLKRAQDMYELFCQATQTKNRGELFHLVRKACLCTFGSSDITFSLFTYDTDSQELQHLKKKTGEIEQFKEGMKGYDFLMKAVKQRKPIEKKDTKVIHRAKPQEETIFTVIIPIFQNNRSLEQSSLNSSMAASSAISSTSSIMALVRMEKAMSSEQAEQLPNKRFFLGRPHSPIFVEAEESEEQRLSNFTNFMGCVVSRVLQISDVNQSNLTFEMSTLKSDNILLAKRLQFAQDFEDELNVSPKSTLRYFDELQDLLQRLIRKHLPQTRQVRLFLRSLYDEEVLVGLTDLNPATNHSQTNSYSITMRDSKDGRVVYSGQHSRRVSLLNKSNAHLPPMYNTSDPKFGAFSRIPSRHESIELTTTQLPSAKFTSFINSSRPQDQAFSAGPSPPNQEINHSATTCSKQLIQSASGLYISTTSYQDHLVDLSTNSVLAETIKSKHLLNIPDVTMHVNFQPLIDIPESFTSTSHKPLSMLLLPLLNGSELEGIVQLIGQPDAMGTSCFSEEDEFILAAVCEKLRGVIANERKHNRETIDLRGKLEETENQLQHSTNVNQTLLAINTFISTQVPCESLALFANATCFFLTKLFSCQTVRLVIVDHMRDALLDFPGDCQRVLLTHLTQAVAHQDTNGLVLRSLRNGTSVMLGEREELGQYIVNQNALVEWMDRNAFLNLLYPDLDVTLNLDSVQNFLQVPLQLDGDTKQSHRIGVLQLFNRSSVEGDYEFNSTDVSLLQLVAQSLAPTIASFILQEAARTQNDHLMFILEIRGGSASRLQQYCFLTSRKLFYLTPQRDQKLFKLFSKHNDRQLFCAFNVFRRRTFQLSIKHHALSAMLGTLNSRFEIAQTPEANLSFNSFMIPFEFRAVQCLPPLLSKWEKRLMSPYFQKWNFLSKKGTEHALFLKRRGRILRSILKFSKQRNLAALLRRAEELFNRWKGQCSRMHWFQSLMSRIFRRRLSRAKIQIFEQWQKFVLMGRFECHSRMVSKTQALKKFLRLRAEMRQKEKSRALSSWLNITRHMARMDFECQKNESVIAEQAHRQQNFLNSLYECCCFFEHSEAAGLKQLVALNTGSFNVVLNSPQVRGFFKIIRNYLAQQVEFKECLFTLKLSFLQGHFFALRLGTSPADTVQSGLFSNRSRDYSQISELMRGVDLSEVSGEESTTQGVYLNVEQDHILRMLTHNRRENALLLQNIHKEADLKPTLQNRGLQSSMRAAAVVPLNIFTFNTEPGSARGIPSMIGTHTLLPEMNNCEVIGTIELYRAQNSFQEDDMNFLKSIGNAVSPCVLSFCSALRNLYISSRQELFNPVSSVRELQGNATLSKVSRFFVKNPQLFQGAEKALLVHLPMSQQTEKSHTAFFYSFSDSHIYNFDYADTFIEQISLTQLPLMFEHSKSVTEQANPDAPFYNFIRYIPILSSGSQISHNFNALKNAIQVRNNPQRVVAVLELCHDRVGDTMQTLVRPEELAEKEIEITQALGNHLSWIRDKVKTFINILGGVERFHKLKSVNRRFQIWKKTANRDLQNSKVQRAKGKMSSLEHQIFEIEGSMEQYQNTIEEYEKKIAQMEEKLNESIESRDQLSEDLESMKLEKKAKLKFLAASLIVGQMETATNGAMRMRNCFDHWKAHAVCFKIAESAFGKVMELNHKHAMARFQTATYLVGSFAKKFQKRMRYFTLRSIVHHAAVTQGPPPVRKILASHSGVLTVTSNHHLTHTPPPGSRKGSIVSRRSLSKENAKPSSPYLTPHSKKKTPTTKRGSSTKRNY